MKIRGGLVSNSSSSSYLIAVNTNELRKFKSTEDYLLSLFKVPRESPIFGIAQSLAAHLSREDRVKSFKQLEHDMGWDDEDEYREDYRHTLAKKAFQRKMTVWKAWGSNEADDPISQLIYYHGLEEVETEDLIITILY